MIKVIRWIILVWTVFAIPYVFIGEFETDFFTFLYTIGIIGILVYDIKKQK